MRDKFRSFMMGRYGNDQLNQFISIIAIIFMVLDVILHSSVLWYVSLVLIVLIYFRTFSKNLDKRYAENEFYLEKKEAIFGRFRKEKYYASQRKDYRIFTCPQCKQKIRIPKGKGKVSVRCPKCNTSFIKRS